MYLNMDNYKDKDQIQFLQKDNYNSLISKKTPFSDGIYMEISFINSAKTEKNSIRPPL